MAAACCGEMRSGSVGVSGPTCGSGTVETGGGGAAEPAEQPAAATSSAATATIEDPLRTDSTVLLPARPELGGILDGYWRDPRPERHHRTKHTRVSNGTGGVVEAGVLAAPHQALGADRAGAVLGDDDLGGPLVR